MKRNIVFFIGFIMLIALSCEKLAEDYMGIPMQPKFIDTTGFEKVMNVFGIIRPESSTFAGNSFVCLVQTLPTKNDTIDDPFINDAEMTVYQTSLSGNTDTIHMQYQSSDTDTSWHVPEYVSPTIIATAGMHYRVNIKHPDYPDVTGETIIPLKPELEQGSLVSNDAKVSFTIKPDTAVHLYDIYLLSDISSFTKRIVPLKNLPTHVELNSGDTEWKFLVIYAYDRNLSIYYSTSTNSFFSFNTYRPSITTVNGGYGCFGSFNFLEVGL